MTDTARLVIGGATHDLPVVVGTEGERALDISKLRDTSGHITLDEGYINTGSCSSAITFVDGERGILRYRGIPIEQLAGQEHLRGDLLAAHLRRAAHSRAAQVLERPLHQVRDDPRGALPPLRRFPRHRPPHGHTVRHDQRDELLRAGPDGDGEPGHLPTGGRPPHQQAAHHRRRQLQGLHRPAHRLPQAAPRLLHATSCT